MESSGDIARSRRQSLGDLPRRSAARFAEKTAFIDRGGIRLTFAEFDDRVDRVCAALLELGFQRGDRLALLARNCWEYPLLVFAGARIGVVIVPINFMLTPPEVAYILDHCEPRGLVVCDELARTGAEAIAIASTPVPIRACIARLDEVPQTWHNVADWIEHDRDAFDEPQIGDDDLIRIMYTSGTESRPKGAMLSSRSLMWQYTSCIVSGGMESSDIEVHSMPLYHCAQLDNFLATDLYLGATSIILPAPEPEAILTAIETEEATNFFAPPTVWISLLGAAGYEPSRLASLRKGYYGASAMPAEVLRELGEKLPDVRLWNFYGQTEMASLATALGPEDQLERGGYAGLPVLNVETRVVDPEGRELEPGHVGEIVHRSPHSTLGYYRDSDKTAEAFRGGWFHSGDLGVFDAEGYLRVVDRHKDMIKSGGENVASREVEEVIYELAGVSEAAVFGVPDDRWVEAVTAAVVVRPDAELDPAQVREHVRSRLAGYKTPKHVVIVDELPKNPSGKILKRDLREQFGDIGSSHVAADRS